jgi:hypothetical protein
MLSESTAAVDTPNSADLEKECAFDCMCSVPAKVEAAMVRYRRVCMGEERVKERSASAMRRSRNADRKRWETATVSG